MTSMTPTKKKRRTRARIVQIMPTTVHTERYSDGLFMDRIQVPHPAVAALDDKGRIWVRSIGATHDWTLLPKLPLEDA
jgi:hypothetical protein